VKWCNYYQCWCSDIDDVVDEIDRECDGECELCGDYEEVN